MRACSLEEVLLLETARAVVTQRLEESPQFRDPHLTQFGIIWHGRRWICAERERPVDEISFFLCRWQGQTQSKQR